MKIIAHRGASGYKPENTLAAFDHALAMGADMIELDVHRLRSGELVVIHDSTVDRTTDGTGRIESYTLEQLKTLNAGDDESVPLLSEVLDLVNGRVPVNIELKGRFTARPLARLLRTYINDRGWNPDQFVVSSFNHATVHTFMMLMPSVPVCALVNRIPFWFMPLCFHKRLHGINFNANYIRAKDIEMAHKLGKKVFVYTVDNSTTAAYLKQLNVDGIFTNYPDLKPVVTSTT